MRLAAALIPVLVVALIFAQGCSRPPTAKPLSDAPLTTETPHEPPAAVTAALTPTLIPAPAKLTLAVPTRWLAAAETALSEIPPGLPSIELFAAEPAELDEGAFDLALLPGSDGIPVADRALALAVPWTSDWEQASLDEAQIILDEGSPFVAAIEWATLSPNLKPLRIDGMHPSQPGYPLHHSWSLHARTGFEEYAAPLARALAEAMADPVVKVVAVGDIMLARGLGEAIRAGGHPFAAVQHLLTDADLTLGNLESALGSGGHPEAKGYTFLAPPEAAGTLAAAGFDALSLANNHAMDYGLKLLLQAIDQLTSHGITSVGAGPDGARAFAPHFFQNNEVELALLAFVDVPIEVRGFDTRSWSAGADRGGVAWADPLMMRDAIQAARRSADVVVVLLHSGYEYISAASPPQQSAARSAIDAGADLVLGHHAHVLQGVEFYGTGVIVYGLGNFAFEDGGIHESGLMNIWLNAEGVRSLEFVPLVLDQDGRPLPPDPARGEALRKQYLSLTRTVQP